jgi:hypothetical protein
MKDQGSAQEQAKRLLGEGGVASFDDLVAKVAQAAEEQGISVPEVLAGRIQHDADAPDLRWRPKPQEGPFAHRPMEVGILLDDQQEVEGADLSRWDGTALDFVVDGGGDQPDRVRAFTVGAAAEEYMRSVAVLRDPPKGFPLPGDDGVPAFHVGGTAARYFEHIFFAGAATSLDLGHVKFDLTQETMSGWWFWAVSWNDQISSVIAGSGWSTLWEHIYPPRYGYPPGSKLHVAPFNVVGNLVPLGWNDRISAINHHFFPE